MEKWSSLNTDLEAEKNLNCQLINKNLTQQGKVLYELEKIAFKMLTVNLSLNPHTPVAQKVADEVGFRRFQGEGVEFFKSELTDPPQIFDAYLLEKTNLSPSSFHISVVFL